MRVIVAAMLLLAGCGPAPATRDARHGYLLVETASVDQGWAVLDALDRQLAPTDRERIRTSAPVGTGPRMFVDFTGDCAANRAFVESARAIARAKGASALTCTATPPG